MVKLEKLILEVTDKMDNKKDARSSIISEAEAVIKNYIKALEAQKINEYKGIKKLKRNRRIVMGLIMLVAGVLVMNFVLM